MYIFKAMLFIKKRNSNLTELNGKLEIAVDGNTINTDVYGKSYLDGNLLAVTFTVNPNGIHYFHPPTIPNYKIFSAINGDYEAWNGSITNIVWNNDSNSNIIFLSEVKTGIIRINALYIKTNW